MKNWLPLVCGPALAIDRIPGFVCLQFRAELVGELEARSARARPQRIAPLNHEGVDHAMKDQSVVEVTLGRLPGLRISELLGSFCEAGEIGDRLRSVLVEQPDLEVAFARGEQRVYHSTIIARTTVLQKCRREVVRA